MGELCHPAEFKQNTADEYMDLETSWFFFFDCLSTVFADHKDPSSPKFCLCAFCLKTLTAGEWVRLWQTNCLPGASTAPSNRRENTLRLWLCSIAFGPTPSHWCLHPTSAQLCRERLTWVSELRSVTYLSIFHSDAQPEQVPDEIHLKKLQDWYFWGYWAGPKTPLLQLPNPCTLLGLMSLTWQSHI